MLINTVVQPEPDCAVAPDQSIAAMTKVTHIAIFVFAISFLFCSSVMPMSS